MDTFRDSDVDRENLLRTPDLIEVKGEPGQNTQTKQAMSKEPNSGQSNTNMQQIFYPSQINKLSQSAIRVSNETTNGGGESLLIFNPKEEAILDQAPNLKFSNQSMGGLARDAARMGSTEAAMMKEAMTHMNQKNEVLADEL